MQQALLNYLNFIQTLNIKDLHNLNKLESRALIS